MNQPAFEFHVAPLTAPYQGGSSLAIEASKSGARKACETRSANIVAMRQLWREPRTINDIAAMMKLPVSSVCSLKNAIKNELEEVDHEVIDWGPGRKQTQRTRWKLKGR